MQPPLASTMIGGCLCALILLLAALPHVHAQCILSDKTNTSLICPSIPNGVYYPANATMFGVNPPEPVALYHAIVNTACHSCGGYMSPVFACSIMLTLYGGACGTQNENASSSLLTGCRSDCLNQDAICQATNKTFSGAAYWDCGPAPGAGNSLYVTCNTTTPDVTCCQANTGGDVCHSPSFLNQDTAGVPNWVWIFIIGGGGLILIIIGIGVFIFFRFERDDVLELVNPCKWCECCPYYYDL